MPMRWQKKGVLYQPTGELWWARSHAAVPTPIRLNENVIRLYVTCRDSQNVGRVGYVDVQSEDPSKVISVSENPILEIGSPGTFDDNGVMATSVVPMSDGRLFLYYVGFELCHHIRYRLLSGLAVSIDGGKSFYRQRVTPILERSENERYFRGGPFVLLEGGRYRMWYVAGSEWFEINGKDVPVYDLRYAESKDGIHWPDEGKICMPISHKDEHGFGRPYVVKRDDGYRLFYSIRRKSLGAYRMGYAESKDGLQWQRMDETFGLDVSDDGWDSEAVCFGAPVTVGDQTYLFYNGNGFGETGIGLAILDE